MSAVKLHPFFCLRIVTALALMALLTKRIMTQGPTINLVLFLTLVTLWFIPTLILNVLHKQTPRAIQLSNALCAVLDAYVLMMSTAEAAADIWTKPFLLLGAYVFLAAILGGTIAGIGSAVSGFCGLLNGWLMPAEAVQPQFVIGGGIASVAGLLLGSAWRLIIPLIVRTAQQQQQQAQTAATPENTTVNPKHEMLAQMQRRLQTITTERNHAQEQWRQIEAQHHTAIDPPPAAPPSPKETTSIPDNGLLTPQAYLQQMEAELADIQTEKTNLATEKQNIQAEISKLSDELMAAFLPPPADEPQKAP